VGKLLGDAVRIVGGRTDHALLTISIKHYYLPDIENKAAMASKTMMAA